MATIANNFFQSLLTTNGRQRSVAIRKVLNEMDIRISQADHRMMEAPFNLEEIRTTTFALAKGRAPGPDGIPIKFYQTFWENIGPTIITMINSVVEAGFLHEDITIGLLILLHKHGDPRLLSNK